jgi:flagellar basal body-associated protein FliL
MDTKTAQSQGPRKTNKKLQLSAGQKKLILIIIIILLGLGILGGVYELGYNKGFAKGEEKGKKDIQSSNFAEYFTSNNPFKSVSGTVRSVSQDTLEVNSSKGEIVKIKITDKTKVTKKTDTLKVSDIRKTRK